MDIQQYNSFAKALVDLFYPLVEVTLLDDKGNMVEIHNAFSNIKEDQNVTVEYLSNRGVFTELLTSGKNVRSLVYSIKASKTTKVGIIRVRFDLSQFSTLSDQLEQILQTKLQPYKVESPVDQWKGVIDLTINNYLKEKKITLASATQKQKREIIAEIEGKGLFDFKEASIYVAQKMQTSRATVYNYLKKITQLKKVHIHQVDTFTDRKFAGNPAGVVLDAELLDDVMMRKITRELNLSETAFVLPSDRGDFQLRYFTPTGHEMIFCGHSTVGTLYMIAHEKRFGIGGPGKYIFEVDTLSGVLKMEVEINNNEEIQVTYETPPVNLKRSKLTCKKVAKAADLKLESLDLSMPVMFEETNKDLYLVVNSLEELKRVELDTKGLSAFCKENDIVALCLIANETFDSGSQFHIRCFAPWVGIPEDPVTGSVLGGLTHYVLDNGLLSNRSKSFQVEQGHFLNRPGTVNISLSKNRGKIQIKVHAQAVHCFSTEVNLS